MLRTVAFSLAVAQAAAFSGVARVPARSSPVMAAKPAPKVAPKAAPVKKAAPAPVKKAPVPVKKVAPKPAPVKKVAPAPVKKAAPAPRPAPVKKALSQPANYAGLIGGFVESGGVYDPINYAKGKDLNRLRSVELKHGRICMLAALGYVVQEVYSWPNTQGYFDGSNPLATPATVPIFGLLQIVLVCGLIETQTGNEWQRGAPGDIGFDPLGLAKGGVNPAYADAELKHGRLAMIGWLGFVLQSAVTGKGVLATTFEAIQ